MLYALIAIVVLAIFALQGYAKHYCEVNSKKLEEARAMRLASIKANS